MIKKTDATPKLVERNYTIPLREKSRVVPRYRKTEKAIKTIKEFVAKHMKVPERDLSKVKIDSYLNEMIWARGIKKHPHKIKVVVVKDGELYFVYAQELPKNLGFKRDRALRKEKESKAKVDKKKAKKEPEEKPKTEEEKKEDAEKKVEEKEKKAAVVEAGKEMEKAAAKQIKQQKQPAFRPPKHQHRKALQK